MKPPADPATMEQPRSIDDIAEEVVRFPGGGAAVVRSDLLFRWAQKSSLWPLTFGLACCAIEMMAFGASRFDVDRFGAGAFRATPRQSDLMIVAGTVTYKMASRVRRLYNQMADPKYVIALGAWRGGGRWRRAPPIV